MADQYQTSVSLLLHCDGTNGATAVTDNSQYTFVPICKGTAALSTTQKQFGTASLKTGNANGNYLLVPTSPAFRFASSDFTVETFVWPVSQGADGGAIIGRWDAGTAGATDWLMWRGANGEVNVSVNGVQLIAGASGDLPTGAFAHVALTRQGSNLQVWVGGVAKGSATISGAVNYTVGLGFVLGQSNASAGATWLEAYYDEVRITNGVARYTAGFTPPAAAFDNLQLPMLLLHMESQFDSSPYMSMMALYGAATLSTAQSKFGGSSLKFTGASTAYATVPHNASALDLVTGDFTIEGWVYPLAYPAYLVDKDGRGGVSYPQYSVLLKADGTLLVFLGSGNGVSSLQQITSGTIVVPLNQWSHFAVTRQGTTIRTFTNGVLDQSVTQTATMIASGQPLYLGGETGQTGFLNGYLDEVRITKGVALYTATFTPPTAAFPDTATPPKVTQPKIQRIYNQAIPFYTRKGFALLPSNGRLKDMLWGGAGSVSGVVTINNAPGSRKVRLFEKRTGILVRETWSDASGNYSFPNIDASKTYLVLGHDYQQVYNAVVQDSITPVGRVVPRSARQKLRFTADGTGLSTSYPVMIRVGETGAYTNLQSNCAILAEVFVSTKAFPGGKNGTSDIIFTDTAGNPLDFWLEQVVGNIGDRVAYYWVKLPGDLDAGPVDLYMTYGAGATNTKSSNGANTFTTLFDDFDGPSLDGGKWTAYNTSGGFASFSNGNLVLQGRNAYTDVRSIASFNAGVEMVANIPTLPNTVSYYDDVGYVGGTGAASQTVAALENLWDRPTVSRLTINNEAASVTTGDFAPRQSSPGRTRLAWASNGVASLYLNDVLTKTRSGVSASSAYLCAARLGDGSLVTLVDYIAVRKCIPSGPPTMIPFAEELL